MNKKSLSHWARYETVPIEELVRVSSQLRLLILFRWKNYAFSIWIKARFYVIFYSLYQEFSIRKSGYYGSYINMTRLK